MPLIPHGVAAGVRTRTLQPSEGDAVETPVNVAAVVPGIFTADGSGSGQASAIAVRVAEDGMQTPMNLLDENAMAIPLDLRGDGQIVVLLFGTLIRGSTGEATVTIKIQIIVDGVPANVVTIEVS